MSDFKQFQPQTRLQWRNWLEANHDTSPGIWLIYFKKAAHKPTISYDDAVEEALAFGWIDSTVNKLDEERYMQKFTPRKVKSIWSRINKERVKKLESEGIMTPAGRAKIEEAKNNGSWNILDDVEDLIIPDDLQEALHQNKTAQNNFNNFSDSVKKQILWWIKSAKRPDTRSNRIKKTIASAMKNERPF